MLRLVCCIGSSSQLGTFTYTEVNLLAEGVFHLVGVAQPDLALLVLKQEERTKQPRGRGLEAEAVLSRLDGHTVFLSK